jgi:nucleotide-binding universal stress UspA family protein
MASMTDARGDDRSARTTLPGLIGVGVDGYPAGRDAVALASALAGATGAELMLISVHVQSHYVLPSGMDWKSVEKQAWATLTETRDSLAPGARIEVQTDALVWRALCHVADFTRAGMLVVGSSHDAPEGRAKLGQHAGELQEHLDLPLAVAPCGMQNGATRGLERIGVGFDDRPESHAAMELAASLASAAGAELTVRGVALPGHRTALSQAASRAADATGAHTRVDITHGRPTEGLRELGEQVDLLVIGSGRTGPAGRILLGNTGHALLRDVPCPVIVAPRPPAEAGS